MAKRGGQQSDLIIGDIEGGELILLLEIGESNKDIVGSKEVAQGAQLFWKKIKIVVGDIENSKSRRHGR